MSAFMSWASWCSAALTLFLLALCLQFPILLERTSPFPLYYTISSFVTLSLCPSPLVLCLSSNLSLLGVRTVLTCFNGFIM